MAGIPRLDNVKSAQMFMSILITGKNMQRLSLHKLSLCKHNWYKIISVKTASAQVFIKSSEFFPLVYFGKSMYMMDKEWQEASREC